MYNKEGKEEKSVFLEKLRMTASEMVSGHTLATTKLDVIKDNVINALVFRLKAEVMAEKLEDRTQEVIFRVPKSWWQHFKHTWFPKWLLKRFPVKFESHKRIVTFKHLATYPQLPLVFRPGEVGQIVYKDFVKVKDERVLGE